MTAWKQTMGAAKSGGRDVRIGEVSVKCAEKTGFPGFEFPRQAKMALGGAKDGSQRNCTLEDQKLAAGCIIYRKRGTGIPVPSNREGEGSTTRLASVTARA
jgi:hypothetical protein